MTKLTALPTSDTAIRDANGFFRTMADSSPVLLWMAGTDARCTFFNRQWLAFTGRPMESEMGLGWAEGIHHEDFADCVDVYLQAFVERKGFRMEYRLRRADGAYRWILDDGVPLHTGEGTFAGFIGSCIDVTENRETREALRQMNEQLGSSFTRARSSSYGRTPSSRSSRPWPPTTCESRCEWSPSYVQLLEKRYKGQLDSEADQYIAFALEGARRMQDLIRDLLECGRVGSTPIDAHPHADANRMFDTALMNLKHVIDETGARVTRELLPSVRADPIQLTQQAVGPFDNE